MELKPCPFCGGKPKIVAHQIAQRKKHYAVQCSCGIRTYFVDRKYKVVELWNRRADTDPEVHGRWIPSPFGNWCCSECKTEGSPRWMRCPVCEAKMDLEVDHEAD